MFPILIYTHNQSLVAQLEINAAHDALTTEITENWSGSKKVIVGEVGTWFWVFCGKKCLTEIMQIESAESYLKVN